jgi:hypothetical protein
MISTSERISEWLMKEYNFKPYHSTTRKPDTNLFSCVLKVSPIHFIYYSDELGYFTLAQNHNEPVNHPASTYKEYFTYIMIPRVARTKEVCETILKTFITGQTFL